MLWSHQRSATYLGKNVGLKITLTASSKRNLGKDEEIELHYWRVKIIIIESNMGKGRHRSGVPGGQNRE